MRHMDDFLTIGPKHRVENFMASAAHTLSMSGITYLDEPGVKSRFLGIDIERIAGGFETPANQDILTALVADVGLDHSKARTLLPGAPGPPLPDDDVAAELFEHSYFRTQTGRQLFTSHHRSDIQQVVGQLCKRIVGPVHRDMRLLNKCIRFTIATRHRCLRLLPRGRLNISGRCDSDWAGDTQTRKSTSGG